MRGRKPHTFGYGFLGRLKRCVTRTVEWQILLWRRMVSREKGMLVFAVYDHPSDFPDRIAIRAYAATPEGGRMLASALLFDCVEQARSTLASFGLYRIDADPSDDPVILETWI